MLYVGITVTARAIRRGGSSLRTIAWHRVTSGLLVAVLTGHSTTRNIVTNGAATSRASRSAVRRIPAGVCGGGASLRRNRVSARHGGSDAGSRPLVRRIPAGVCRALFSSLLGTWICAGVCSGSGGLRSIRVLTRGSDTGRSGPGCPGALALEFIESTLYLLSASCCDGLSIALTTTTVSGSQGMSADDLSRP